MPDNPTLHRTAISLRSIAASEPGLGCRIMRYLCIVLSLYLCPLTHASSPSCVMSDEATRECYAQLEAQTLKAFGRYISKSGNTLTIASRNGTTVRFTSNPGGRNYDEVHNYMVLGVLSAGQFAVVLDGRWEGRDIHLVSLVGGAAYEVAGMPLASPDRKRVLVHSKDLDANYDSNFIAIYRIDASKLIKEQVLDGDSDPSGMWGPGNIRWVTQSKIAFDRVSYSSIGPEYISVPWVLLKDKFTWKAKPATQPAAAHDAARKRAAPVSVGVGDQSTIRRLQNR